jgi:hypothetical protein
VLLAIPAIALASDILSVDGDALTSNADTAIDLGTVDPGQAIKATDGNDYQASFQLACDVQGSNRTHVDRGKIVKLTYSAADSQLNGATVSATDATITPTPTNTSWPTDGNTCPATAPVLNDTGNSTLTMTAPKASGKKVVSVAYSYTVRNADGTLYASEDDKAIQGGYPGTKTIKYTSGQQDY